MNNSPSFYNGPLFSSRSKKPKFSIDADDVMFKLVPELDAFLASEGVKIREDDYWRGLSREDNRKYFLKFLESHPYLTIPYYEEVLWAINTLSIMYNPVINTARGSAAEGEVEDTLLRLRIDDLPYYQIFFDPKKGDLAKRHQLAGSVDDSLEKALDIKNKSPDTRMYLVDKLYNQCDDKKYDLIRVESLAEVAKIELKLWYNQN